jgi:acyl-CoA thioesterase
MTSQAEPVLHAAGTGLAELLTLERIEDDMFRTIIVSAEPAGLYGGRVAAQALRAAAETVLLAGIRTHCTAISSAGVTHRTGCC